MSWPPDDDERREILRLFPATADRRAVWEMVETAVRIFLETAESDEAHRILLRQIGKTGAKTVEKLRALALELSRFPLDRDAAALLQHVDALAQICTAAEIRAAIYLLRSRKGRLFSGLSLAWTGPGKGDMPISEQGPFVEFMESIVNRVLPPHAIDVKRWVPREKARRKALDVINERFAGQSHLVVSETYLTDSSGQRNPD
jgi:hypothetical protein